MPALISENRFADREFPIFNTPAIIIDTNAGLNEMPVDSNPTAISEKLLHS